MKGNSGDKALLLGVLFSCVSGWGSFFALPFFIFNVFYRGVELRKVILTVIIFCLFTLITIIAYAYSGVLEIPALVLALLTVSLYVLISNESLIQSRNTIINIIAYSVPFSIVISILRTFGISLWEYRSNEVLGLMRLTFLFAEPSHYAIILSLSLLMAIISKSKMKVVVVLAIGLLLTWSLSGFMLFGLGYFLSYFYSRNIFKAVLYCLISLLLLIVIWVFFLSGSDFWIVSKIDSVFFLFQGATTASSALLRFNSMILWKYYIVDAINNSHYYLLVSGEGFGNITAWVQNYYFSNFNIPDITQANNLISNVFISTGLMGFILYIIVFISFLKITLKNIFLSLSFLFVLSLFSGYAFGPLAIMTLLLTRLTILSILYARHK
ncbi:hypothetical protein [Buttiauxella massiliensis]|uniref:hypothetical protein n=1 Tax=Buttiauxella massiliensis TaxID=2831590 RepID=UPI00125F39D7|nr:hypothetical protein [Buttiauxella massiliensis]